MTCVGRRLFCESVAHWQAKYLSPSRTSFSCLWSGGQSVNWSRDIVFIVSYSIGENSVLQPMVSSQWRHNERGGVSNRRHFDCLLNRLFRRILKKAPKRRVTGLYEGDSPVTGEFPAQRASNAENVSILWRHHAYAYSMKCTLFNALTRLKYTPEHCSRLVCK